MSTATLERKTYRRTTYNSVLGNQRSWSEWMEAIGAHSIRYSLVLVLVWIGGMKFTAYEANGISGLVSYSPLMSWAYQVFSVRQFGVVLGTSELIIALLIASRPIFARLSVVGSGLAVGMFMTTLSFLLTTPGVTEASLGFPGLSVLPGQFLLKDFVLLGAAVWATGEALRAHNNRNAETAD